MTNYLDIHYSKDRNIILELDDYIYFTGSNIQTKQSIINTLNRFNTGKKLNDLEENVFGEEGIKIVYNEKPLNSKDVMVINISSFESVLNELTIKRGSLLFDELNNLDIDLKLSSQMEKLNDELLTLEFVISNKLKYLSQDATYSLKEIILQDLLTKSLEISYFENEQEIPLDYRDKTKIISEFIELVKNYVYRTGNMIWIVLDQPFSFFKSNEFEMLLQRLLAISNESKLLKLFIFNSIQNNSDYMFDIEKTVVIYQSYQQLPKVDVFVQSIERNYPDELTIEEVDLLASFFRISHLIGQSMDEKYSIAPRDMILLTILKDLLGDSTTIETSIVELSSMEKAFLERNE